MTELYEPGPDEISAYRQGARAVFDDILAIRDLCRRDGAKGTAGVLQELLEHLHKKGVWNLPDPARADLRKCADDWS